MLYYQQSAGTFKQAGLSFTNKFRREETEQLKPSTCRLCSIIQIHGSKKARAYQNPMDTKQGRAQIQMLFTHSSRPRQSTGARKGAASPRASRLLVREVILRKAASAEPVPPLGMLNYISSPCRLLTNQYVSVSFPATTAEQKRQAAF